MQEVCTLVLVSEISVFYMHKKEKVVEIIFFASRNHILN